MARTDRELEAMASESEGEILESTEVQGNGIPQYDGPNDSDGHNRSRAASNRPSSSGHGSGWGGSRHNTPSYRTGHGPYGTHPSRPSSNDPGVNQRHFGDGHTLSSTSGKHGRVNRRYDDDIDYATPSTQYSSQGFNSGRNGSRHPRDGQNYRRDDRSHVYNHYNDSHRDRSPNHGHQHSDRRYRDQDRSYNGSRGHRRNRDRSRSPRPEHDRDRNYRDYRVRVDGGDRKPQAQKDGHRRCDKTKEPERPKVIDDDIKMTEPSEPVPEVSIEERRRRRAELKLKLAAQSATATPQSEQVPTPTTSAPPPKLDVVAAKLENHTSKVDGPQRASETVLQKPRLVADIKVAAPKQESLAINSEQSSPTDGNVSMHEFADDLPGDQSQRDIQSSGRSDITPEFSLVKGGTGAGAANNADDIAAADVDVNKEKAEELRRHYGFGVSNADDDAQSLVKSPSDADTEAGTKDDDSDIDMFAEDEETFDRKLNAAAKKKAEMDVEEARRVQKLGRGTQYTNADFSFNARPGDFFGKTYRLKEKSGAGTFSTVWIAENLHSKQLRAIKIVRKNDMMAQEGRKEIRHLEEFQKEKYDNIRKSIIRYLGKGTIHGHLYLVFEKMDKSLRNLLVEQAQHSAKQAQQAAAQARAEGRKGHPKEGHKGFPFGAIQYWAKSILQALDFLKKVEFVHGDLKPDNLLVTENGHDIKVCDFGTAFHVSDAQNGDTIKNELGSRFYRAPELMLGFKYGMEIDMWSIACTLFELYTGVVLFKGFSNNRMLFEIQQCKGKFPFKLLKHCRLASNFFDDKHVFYSEYEDPTSQNGIGIRPLVKVEDPTRSIKHRINAVPMDDNLGRKEKEIRTEFIDLLDRMLSLHVDRRLTPEQALQHKFFRLDCRPGKAGEVLVAAAPKPKPKISFPFVPDSVRRNMMAKAQASKSVTPARQTDPQLR